MGGLTMGGQPSGDQLTITLIGDPGGGKTSIKQRLIGKDFNSNEKITVGADFTFLQMEDSFRLKICDIAGQASFATVRRSFLARSDAALVIFDLTNPSSLDSLEGWLREYLSANRGTNPPLLLIGNKADLVDAREIGMAQVKRFLELAEENPRFANRIIGYLETSA
ncbi:MAG: Rab family GTPase, partial [Candidatus Kariarchaeaceae archaeon]